MNPIDARTLARTAELSRDFLPREPFRHLVIDDFFEADYAAQLSAEFPSFESGNARNEAGELGSKSVVERIRAIGPAYRQLDELVQSSGFLQWLGEVTSIPELLYDPWYFGGGTHENRSGQDLDAHVDFNRHPIQGWHRRLNLIVYLNRQWQDEWGGSLELHSDPRAADNRTSVITPLFNRAVVFETTEWSWHGFPRIHAAEDGTPRSRKSIALYFYSRERPAEELAATHSTIYVDQPLPAYLAAGRTLSDEDHQTLQILLARRDQHIQRLYRDLQDLRTQLEQAQQALQGGRSLGRLRYLLARLRARLRG